MIKHPDIINRSYYGIGFTDQPVVCRLFQTRFLNIWYTNFAGDESGIMEFECDLYATGVPPTPLSPQAFAVVRV